MIVYVSVCNHQTYRLSGHKHICLEFTQFLSTSNFGYPFFVANYKNAYI